MKTKKFLSMAALALVGAMMTGCSNDDNYQQPENKNNVVTLTTTIGLDDGGTTRALTATGVKTFAAGDQIAVIYTKNGGTVTKAVSEALPAGSYGANATFTVTLDDPDRTQNVTYIYPAAMAGSTGVDYTKLNSQSSGTLTDLGRKYDLATKSGAWNGDNLPTLTLENQLAILAINLKNSTGTSDITGDISDMTISDGTNTYAVNFWAAAGPIYVAIRPTSSATIYVTATDGTHEYGKTLATTKTYEAGNGYNVTWNMSEMTTITWNSSNISDLSVSGTYASYTNEDIRLSTAEQNYAYWQDYGDESGIGFHANASGGFTFTALDGKKLTKIEMTLTGSGGWNGASLGTGWAYAEDFDPMTMDDPICKVTWTGTAATTVNLLKDAGYFGGENVKSIVFTVY